MSHKIGPWAQVGAWFHAVKLGLFMDRYEKDFQALAAAVRDKVQDHIRNQDLGWAPLSASTVARKGFAEIYVETFTFVESVKAQVSRGGRFSIHLKVAPTGGHGPSGLSMSVLASMLEFGTKKMPARPVWRPVMSEVRGMPEYRSLFVVGSRFSFGGVF